MNATERKRQEPLDCKVLVTPTSFGKGDPGLRAALQEAVREVVYNPFNRPLTSAELVPLVGDIDGYIAGLDHIDERVIQAALRLKVIARYGTGVDRVDLAATTRKGIVVTNTPGANAAAVAEMTIVLMLAVGREICRADRETRCGQWPRIAGVGLRGKTVGLIGFGAVGREVAIRLMGFGCRILVSDPLTTARIAADFGVQALPLEPLLASSDFVCLHASLNPGTAGMVDAGFLSKMKPGAFLVNTARGELIDEDALQAALAKGRIRGAALDCFCKEPPEAEYPFFRLPQVLVTPHIASHTDEAANAMGWMSLQACLDVLRGKRCPHTVNPDVYEKRQ